MNKKMLFVFNPKAGKGKIKTNLLDIVDIFNKGGYEVIIYSTQKPKDAYEKAKEYESKVDLIVCSGGLFMPKSMTDAASMIMEEKLYHCDIGRFNNQSFTYIAAFGLFTDVAYQTDQDLKNILGHVAYLLEGVKRLFDIKSYHMRIESEELTVEDDFIFGMITNSRSVGGFKNLTGKNVDMNDGLFEVTMITRPKNPLELQEIMTAMLTAEDNTDLIHSFKSARVTITSEEPVPWTLDGEYGGSHTQIEIENCHEALNLYLKSTKNEETRSIGISPLINKKEK